MAASRWKSWLQTLPLKFLEVDEERNRLVLSHRRWSNAR